MFGPKRPWFLFSLSNSRPSEQTHPLLHQACPRALSWGLFSLSFTFFLLAIFSANSVCISNATQVTPSFTFKANQSPHSQPPPKSTLSKVDHFSVFIDSSPVSPQPQVKSLGVIFDNSSSFQSHISNITQSAYFHLCDINCLCPSLTSILVHSLFVKFFWAVLKSLYSVLKSFERCL